eukprot:GILK01006538.1.p1 GENE.GILK01006538.1~~GILK01006538.1.p1  ORF type:complete len:105 (+),score=1.51 GILK01006538.1:80-394(+)
MRCTQQHTPSEVILQTKTKLHHCGGRSNCDNERVSVRQDMRLFTAKKEKRQDTQIARKTSSCEIGTTATLVSSTSSFSQSRRYPKTHEHNPGRNLWCYAHHEQR